jgi:hypothetical protein
MAVISSAFALRWQTAVQKQISGLPNQLQAPPVRWLFSKTISTDLVASTWRAM